MSRAGHRRYRSLLGSLSYLQHTRLDLLFALSFFGRFANKPTEYALRLLEHTCFYAKSTASLGLVFPSRVGSAKGIRNGDVLAGIRERTESSTAWVIDCFSDASHGLREVAGHFILVNGMPVVHRAYTLRKQGVSSTHSETYALYDAVEICRSMIEFAHELHMESYYGSCWLGGQCMVRLGRSYSVVAV